MQKNDFIVQSDYDGLDLHGRLYTPNIKAKGIVLILHGMCEYKERYDEFMNFLAANGYVVACYDQRGHGDSVKSEDDLGWFGDKDAKAIVDDVVKVVEYLKAAYPNLPFTLLGHSMGSMVVRCFIQEHDDLIDKLIVSGSPSKNSLSVAGILLAKVVGKFRGDRYRSKMISFMATGKGDKKFPKEGKGAWLSKNYKCTEKFYSNPKGSFRFTCNGFENLFKLMKRTYQAKGYQVKNPTLPIHFISGDKDAVMISSMKWVNSLDFLLDVGYENVTGKLYNDFRHEVLNEIGRKDVYKDVLAFLESDPETIVEEME